MSGGVEQSPIPAGKIFWALVGLVLAVLAIMSFGFILLAIFCVLLLVAAILMLPALALHCLLVKLGRNGFVTRHYGPNGIRMTFNPFRREAWRKRSS